MKRTLCLLVALAMIIAAVPALVFAAVDIRDGDGGGGGQKPHTHNYSQIIYLKDTSMKPVSYGDQQHCFRMKKYRKCGCGAKYLVDSFLAYENHNRDQIDVVANRTEYNAKKHWTHIEKMVSCSDCGQYLDTIILNLYEKDHVFNQYKATGDLKNGCMVYAYFCECGARQP